MQNYKKMQNDKITKKMKNYKLKKTCLAHQIFFFAIAKKNFSPSTFLQNYKNYKKCKITKLQK